MELTVIRYSTRGQSTLGMLLIDGEFACYTLEDEYRENKVPGETRIPAGRYQLGLRTEGGFHERYQRKFGSMHCGMLHVKDVPGFQWILIHVGNTDADTEGCLLVGDTSNNNNADDGFIGNSTAAYKRIYPRIARAIQNDEQVVIEYRDGFDGRAIPRPAELPAGRPATVQADRLNMRLAAGASGHRVGVLLKGAPVEIEEEVAGWCRLRVEAWVARDYLT